jgi:diguanylate cyclase (GGDEF)-like protein
VLRKVAWLLADNLRGYDLLGRYGGEEFLIVLPETSRDQAIQVCERLRLAVASHSFAGRESFGMTISLGIAWKAAEGKGKFDRLFASADQCLYEAKDSGRNRVVCAGEAA